jgi:hypothetical protein
MVVRGWRNPLSRREVYVVEISFCRNHAQRVIRSVSREPRDMFLEGSFAARGVIKGPRKKPLGTQG